MKFITYIIAALMLLTVPTLAAGTEKGSAPDQGVFVTLMPNAVLDDGVVRLGDIFQGVGDNADRVVAYAPRPGSRAVFDARWLGRVAKAYKLNWRPSSKADRIVIERASQIITKGDVENLLQQQLREDGSDPSDRAVLSNRAFSLHLPTNQANGGELDLGVEQMSVDPNSGRFTAVVSWGNSVDDRVRLTGRVERMTEVPVLLDRVMRGEVIDKSNVEWQFLAEARLPNSAITDVTQLVGMAAKRSLQAGKPITASDVHRPLMVNRGETVTIYLTTPAMQLSTKGKALEHGSEGDTIRISNTQTNTVVDAIVTGPGQARVETIVNLAMR